MKPPSPRAQRNVLIAIAIAGLVAAFAGVSSIARLAAKRQLVADYDAFVVEGAAWNRVEKPNAIPDASADCDTWSALMNAAATGPKNVPPIAKLGTAPTPAQHDAIAGASGSIAEMRAALRCKRRTRELTSATLDFKTTMTRSQTLYRIDVALAFRGAERLAAIGTNDPSGQSPEAHAEAAQEVVDSLESALLLENDGLQMSRRFGAGLVQKIAPYLAAHVAELPLSALREIAASEYPTLIEDVAAERLDQIGRANVMLASSGEVCAQESALECAFQAHGALRVNDLLAAMAASSDRPFNQNKCTSEANAIAGSSPQPSALSFLCVPVAASALARDSFDALQGAVRARLASSPPTESAH